MMMMMNFNNSILIRLVLLFISTKLTTQQQQHVLPISLQTGPDLSGSSFASSVTYDSHSHTIVITGSTFGRYFTTVAEATASDTPRFTSNCFVATIVLPDNELSFDSSSTTSRKLQWSTKQVLGGTIDDTVHEACTMTLFHPQNKEKIFVLGFSEVGGTFDTLTDLSGFDVIKHYGLLLDIDIDATSPTQEQPYHILGGRAIQDFPITYPIMATIQNEYIYVVSQATDTISRQNSESNTDNAFVDNTTSTTYNINNEVDPMRYFKFGDEYGMSLRRYRNYPLPKSAEEDAVYDVTFEEEWDTNYFATTLVDNIRSVESVHVAGMLFMNDDTFIVVGSTSGDGPEFGRSRNGTDTSADDSATLHGFATKFYLANGTLVPESTNNYGVTIKGTRSIQSSVEAGRVWIAGTCQHLTKEPNAIYIVGATEGQILSDDPSKFSEGDTSDGTATYNGVDAYVIKMDTTTLEEIWIRQIKGIDSESMVRGISCAIATNENAIWVGGVVQQDGVVVHADTISSFGGDDIFVVKMNSDDGAHIFTRQIGSTEDDGIAMRGGIVLDRDDNCIVVGNTYGSMYRVRTSEEVGSDNSVGDDTKWISDVFVTTIRGSDGLISYPISHPEFQSQPGSGSTGEGVDVSISPEDEIKKSSNGGAKSTVVIVTLLAVICSIVAAVLFLRNRSKSNRDASTDRSKVILFLNDFDVDDIDLKHSATGGWHCFYSNDLTKGHNRRASEQHRTPSYGGLSPLASDRSKLSTLGRDPLLTAPLTSSSLIKESLFMNDDDDDELDDNDRNSLDGGNRFNESSTTKQRPGYNGLLDEYNSDWNNRRRQSNAIDDDEQLNDVWGKEIL